MPWVKDNLRFKKSRAYQYIEWANFQSTGNLVKDEAAWQRISGNPKPTAAELIVASNENNWYTPARYVEAARRAELRKSAPGCRFDHRRGGRVGQARGRAKMARGARRAGTDGPRVARRPAASWAILAQGKGPRRKALPNRAPRPR